MKKKSLYQNVSFNYWSRMLSKVHHNTNILVENFIELMKSNKNGMNRKAYIKIRK